MGTQLREVESGFRFTPTTTFETYPFPDPTPDQRQAVAAAAKKLDDLRRGWLLAEGLSEASLRKRTLTNLYNDPPTWLRNAHEALDRAIHAAYGWGHPLSADDALRHLATLNLDRRTADDNPRGLVMPGSERRPPRLSV
jgi:hypothetical protein